MRNWKIGLAVVFISLLAACAGKSNSSRTIASEYNGPHYAAFASQDKLYVTLMANCNTKVGEALLVEEECREGRAMKNLAHDCRATLPVMHTRMGCVGPREPKVYEFDLRKSKVAREARQLHLNYSDKIVTVDLE